MNPEAITDAIARQEWIRPVEEGLQRAVETTFRSGGEAGRKVEDFLHGTWFGHPLHPAITDIPIGAWTVAATMDVAHAVTGRKRYATAADWCVVVGLGGAIDAAVTGLTDWHKTDGRARRVGLFHGLMNLTATSLYAASWVLRRRRQREAARVCGWLGYGFMFCAAYLGGMLVYGERVGVDHADRHPLPGTFVPVLAADQLPENQPRRVEVNGVEVMLVRRDGAIFALAERCSHMGGPLSEGELTDGSVICPWHGSRFALKNGQVLDGPATFPQPCFEARINNGQIELRMPAHGAGRELTAAS